MKKIFLFIVTGIFLLACNKQIQQATLLFEQGKTQEEKGHSDTAIIYYKKAIDLLEPAQAPKLQGEIYNRIGDLYLYYSFYPYASKAYQKALEHNFILTDKSQASYSLRGLGKSYAYMDKADSALHYHLQAYQLIPQIEDSSEIINIYNNLAVSYLTIGQYDNAELYNAKSLKLSQDSTNILRCYSIKADIFLAQNQYDSAWIYLKAGTLSDNLYTQASSYLHLSELAKQFGDTTNYMNYFLIINDSIERSAQGASIANEELEYTENERAKEKQTFTLWIICALLGGCLFAYLSKLYFKKKQERKVQEAMFRLQESENKIKELHVHLENINNKWELKEEEKRIERELSCKVQQLKEDLKTILNNIKKTGDLSAKRFMKSKAYFAMQTDLQIESPCLSQTQREEYIRQIFKSFEPYIERLSTSTSMSKEDCLLCCLFLIGFNTKVCACIRSISETSIRSQKSRIREKIEKAFGTNKAFDYLFKNLNQL